MKLVYILLVSFLISACDPENEKSESFVLASHIKKANEICQPNGILDKVKSSYCRGRGCQRPGWTVSGTCQNKDSGDYVGFVYHFKEEMK